MQWFLGMLDRMGRRTIFTMMFVAVAVPILLQLEFPERAGILSQRTFNAIEELPSGSKVLFSFDYDPASEGELQPMANALLHQCASKGHKLYFMALWPLGDSKARETIDRILHRYHPNYQYGRDYVELGFKAGNEGVIAVIVTDLPRLFPTDGAGTPLDKLPIMAGIENIQAMDLLISVSAGYPGSKEWAQYFISAFPSEQCVTGTTGVQAVSLYPYIPQQITGMLGAIKGAAEYEKLVNERYPGPDGMPLAVLQEGGRRMGPQLTAHLLMIALIVLGNVSYFGRGRRGARR